jgi:hypothetical protein
MTTTIQIQRFDLGWRSAKGSYGVISASGTLPPDIMSHLMALTDSAQERFKEYWSWGSISERRLALIRVSPQVGGLRGGDASTAQVIVLNKDDVPWGVNLSTLLTLFPPAPSVIGEQAAWGVNNTIELVSFSNRQQISEINARREAIATLIDCNNDAVHLEIPTPAAFETLHDEIVEILTLYALCPLATRFRIEQRFTTRSAPASRSEFVLSNPRKLSNSSRSSGAMIWLLATTELASCLPPNGIATLDPYRPDEVAGQLVREIIRQGETAPLLALLKYFGATKQGVSSIVNEIEAALTTMDIPQLENWLCNYEKSISIFKEAGMPEMMPLRIMSEKLSDNPSVKVSDFHKVQILSQLSGLVLNQLAQVEPSGLRQESNQQWLTMYLKVLAKINLTPKNENLFKQLSEKILLKGILFGLYSATLSVIAKFQGTVYQEIAKKVHQGLVMDTPSFSRAIYHIKGLQEKHLVNENYLGRLFELSVNLDYTDERIARAEAIANAMEQLKKQNSVSELLEAFAKIAPKNKDDQNQTAKLAGLICKVFEMQSQIG